MFTRNSAGVGVKNGNIGTVTRIAGRSLTVEVESKFRTFSADDYQSLSLGYAVTYSPRPGVTTDNAFLLTNEMMQDRELSYVQVSQGAKFNDDVHDSSRGRQRLDRLAPEPCSGHDKRT